MVQWVPERLLVYPSRYTNRYPRREEDIIMAAIAAEGIAGNRILSD